MKIGNLGSDGRVVLGPMSGFTSAAYREFMKPFGVAFSISEMTSDSAIVHGTERTSGYVRFGSCPYTGLQLFGHDPETMANAAAIALRDNPNIDFFDVNMSCPVEKVVRSGSGSALMSDPRRCGDIVRAVRSAVDVPVTVKIRLGTTMEALNFRDVIEETVAAGADAVSLLHNITVAVIAPATPSGTEKRGLLVPVIDYAVHMRVGRFNFVFSHQR